MNTVPPPHRQEGTAITAHRAPPRAMSYYDDFFHLRKGTAIRAARNGQLKVIFCRRRCGQICWTLPHSAEICFLTGVPTEPEMNLKKAAEKRFTAKSSPRSRCLAGTHRTYSKKSVHLAKPISSILIPIVAFIRVFTSCKLMFEFLLRLLG
jgi:hypothetical protein